MARALNGPQFSRAGTCKVSPARGRPRPAHGHSTRDAAVAGGAASHQPARVAGRPVAAAVQAVRALGDGGGGAVLAGP